MGIKGDKASELSAQAAELIIEKLESLGPIRSKKMFGGHGIFHDGQMFAMINSEGETSFKYDESNEAALLKAGGTAHAKMPYISITEKTIANFDLLLKLADDAIDVSKK